MSRPIIRNDFSQFKGGVPKTFSEKKAPKPISKKRKATGELEMFQDIWNRRPHRSQFSLTPIEEFDVRCFAHVLPKSTHKQFRLDPRNIKLLTADEHDMQTNVARSDWPKEFREWFEFHEEELKTEYNQKHPTK